MLSHDKIDANKIRSDCFVDKIKHACFNKELFCKIRLFLRVGLIQLNISGEHHIYR